MLVRNHLADGRYIFIVLNHSTANVYFPMARLKPIARVLTPLAAKLLGGYTIQEESLAGVISVRKYYPIYVSKQALAFGQVGEAKEDL